MKSTPDPPDYRAAAEETAASSRAVTEQQTWANRPTINTPFGQQTWNVTPQWDPATEQYLNAWEMNTNLTPESQAALDSQQRVTLGRSTIAENLLGRVQSEYDTPMDWGGFDPLAQTPEFNDYSTSGLPDFGNLPGMPSYSPEGIQRQLDTSGLQNVDPSSRYNQNAGDAIYNQFSSRAEPQFARDTDALRTQLYNQGLREGDEAYNRELEDLRQSQNDARQQASYQATIGAGQEAARMHGMDLGTRGQQFGERSGIGAFANQAAAQALQQQLGIGSQQFQQGTALAGLQDAQRAQAGQEQLAFGQNRFAEQMQGAQYQNQLRQQQIAEAMQQRGFSLNEIQALLNGQQVALPNMPGFNSAQRSETTDYSGAARDQYGAEMDAFNAQQQQMQGLMQGAMGGAMMFSDIRLKDDIIFKGMDVRGLPWYTYRYIWDDPDTRWTGVLAHEVTHIPGAVVVHPSGYLMVNYAVLKS